MKEALQEILSQEAKSRDVRNKVIIVWMAKNKEQISIFDIMEE